MKDVRALCEEGREVNCGKMSVLTSHGNMLTRTEARYRDVVRNDVAV